MTTIITYLNLYPTVRYAAVAILLISLCSAFLGVTLILKRYSMIGDGLSHVSFASASIAAVLGLTTPIYITLPVTVICAVLLLKIRTSSTIKGDSAIAMISSGALALGYIALSLFGSNSANISSDACATLFGSGIIGITMDDIILCSLLSVVVLIVFVLFYNRIFAVTFDEDFAKATGTRTEIYNLLIAIVTAVTIVLAMNLLGALLSSALIIFPALSSMRLFKTFKKVMIGALIISFFSSIVGIIVSLLLSSAIGPTIAVVNLTVFIVCCIVGRVTKS